MEVEPLRLVLEKGLFPVSEESKSSELEGAKENGSAVHLSLGEFDGWPPLVSTTISTGPPAWKLEP